jgi:hypothetical protein
VVSSDNFLSLEHTEKNVNELPKRDNDK